MEQQRETDTTRYGEHPRDWRMKRTRKIANIYDAMFRTSSIGVSAPRLKIEEPGPSKRQKLRLALRQAINIPAEERPVNVRRAVSFAFFSLKTRRQVLALYP